MVCKRWYPLPGKVGTEEPCLPPRATHHPEEALGQLLQLMGLLTDAPEEPGPGRDDPRLRAGDISEWQCRPATVPGIAVRGGWCPGGG